MLCPHAVPDRSTCSRRVSDAAVSRSMRRFVAFFLLLILCAALSYWLAELFFPLTPGTSYRLTHCDTPQSIYAWARCVSEWLSGTAGQLLFLFLGTVSFFPSFFSGTVAVWRGFCLGGVLWMYTHSSVQLGNAGGALFLSAYFAVSALLLFYGTLERKLSFWERIPGFLLTSGVCFSIYLVPLFSAVIFL